MTKVEYGKSQKWIDTHCSICKKVFSPNEDRANGKAVFKNDEVLEFYACLPCMKSAEIKEAVKQTKEMAEDARPES